MPDRFDPYHKWLGIPAAEQPPNHYRLLGVALFEADMDVISNAADQRMGLLKSFATGAYGSLSQELLNQVARARVCLLNPARKATYDDVLRKKSLHDYMSKGLAKVESDGAQQKSIQTRGELPNPATSRVSTTSDYGFHFDPKLTAPIPDVGFAALQRKKKNTSAVRTLLGIILGGVAGLSAGYLVLCLFGDKYDALHLMSVERSAASRTVPDQKPRIVSRDIPVEEPGRPVALAAPNSKMPALPPARKPIVEDQPDLSIPPIAKPFAAKVPTRVPAADIDVFDKPSGIVTLTLEKPVTRVIAESDKASEIVCDIGFSHNLLHRGDNREGYKLVSQGLGHRAKETIELGANIQGGGAAVEITVVRRNSIVTCELRPLFSLPSGDIQPLTISRGTIVHNKLGKSLDAAKSARDTLPTMRSNLSKLQSDLQFAQRATTANSNTPATTGAMRTAAISQAAVLGRQITALRRKITSAEQISAQEPEISKDLQLLDEVAAYAKSIASVSTVSVRFRHGNKTIPATVK